MEVLHEVVFEVECVKLHVCHNNGQVLLREDRQEIDLTAATSDQVDLLLAMSQMFSDAAKVIVAQMKEEAEA